MTWLPCCLVIAIEVMKWLIATSALTCSFHASQAVIGLRLLRHGTPDFHDCATERFGPYKRLQIGILPLLW